jgi:DNA-binding transcriptional ArsR family regulator
VDAALRALADPRRREIIRLVRFEEQAAGEIASHFDVSRPAISQHLAVLREAGLVDERRVGNHRLYRARPEGLAEIRAYLEEFWDDHLDRLKAAVENDREGSTS